MELLIWAAVLLIEESNFASASCFRISNNILKCLPTFWGGGAREGREREGCDAWSNTAPHSFESAMEEKNKYLQNLEEDLLWDSPPLLFLLLHRYLVSITTQGDC